MLTTTMGKGLIDGSTPPKTVNAFGAPFGSVSFPGWAAPVYATSQTTLFDVSTLKPGVEVVAAASNLTNPPPGTYHLRMAWYRGSQAEPIYQYEADITFIPLTRAGIFSVIGYAAWEIDRNGAYQLIVTAQGNQNYRNVVDFEVVGVKPLTGPTPVPTPVPVPVGGILRPLIEGALAASKWLYSLYLETYGWVWPLHVVANIFYGLSQVATDAASWLSDANTWLTDLADKVAQAFDWDTLKKLILEWLPDIEELVAWFGDVTNNIRGVLDTWWTTALDAVKSLIATATQGFATLVAAWDEFRTTVLPSLVSFSWLATWWASQLPGIQSLIDSTIKRAFPFYDDLVSIWTGIRDFFADPLQWLYNQLDRFFERFW